MYLMLGCSDAWTRLDEAVVIENGMSSNMRLHLSSMLLASQVAVCNLSNAKYVVPEVLKPSASAKA